jgi:hypothetical protein
MGRKEETNLSSVRGCGVRRDVGTGTDNYPVFEIVQVKPTGPAEEDEGEE